MNPTPPPQPRSTRGAFAIVTCLFFIWGFITSVNDILVFQFRKAFTLSLFESQLVQFAFFGAYFIASTLYFIISVTSGDPIARMGYRRGVVLGLVLAALGTALFWPAGSFVSYDLFLTGLFILGLGLAMLQIAANPYVTLLGPEQSAAGRLNLAQGFNSLGTVLGPFLAGYWIFQLFANSGTHPSDAVRIPYGAFCGAFVILAVIFSFIHLPDVGEEKVEKGAGALRMPHVVLGIIAIFMYVGGEVSIGSEVLNFLRLPQVAGMNEIAGKLFVSLFWAGLMIGRFIAAVELSALPKLRKQLLVAAIPVAAWLILCAIRGPHVAIAYAPFLVGCWALFQLGAALPARTLGLFSLAVSALMVVAMFAGGHIAMWCVIGAGLFSSIGWTNTFPLALEGTGNFKSQASSLLVMGVLGGALLPPLQGKLADHTSLQFSFIVPALAYLYVSFYGWKGCRIGRT